MKPLDWITLFGIPGFASFAFAPVAGLVIFVLLLAHFNGWFPWS